MLTCSAALALINSADTTRQKWLTAAESAEKIYESGEWRQSYSKVGDWIDAVAAAADVGENLLRRWMAARRFLVGYCRAHPESELIAMAESGQLPFSAAEILKRMNDLSPEDTVTTIQKFKDRHITLRDLRRIYAPILERVQTFKVPERRPFSDEMDFPADEPAAHKIHHKALASKLAQKSDQEVLLKIFALIGDSLEELSGPPERVSLFFRHYRFRYVRPQAVAVGRLDHGIDFVDAFDVKRTRGPGVFKSQMLAEAEFVSSFFRRYWIVIHGPRTEARRLADDLSALDLRSIGVISIDPADMRLEIVVAPLGLPQYDRTDMAKTEVFQQGVPG